MRRRSLILLALVVGTVFATIDMNQKQFQHLADHLRPEECVSLVARLHYKQPELLSAKVQLTEQRVPQDLSCLSLLLHWNSERGGGRGESHQMVAQKLRSIQREDLAVWLSKQVFDQLSADLDRSALAFGEEEPENSTNQKPSISWTTVDFVALTIIGCCASLTIVFCVVHTLPDDWLKGRRNFMDNSFAKDFFDEKTGKQSIAADRNKQRQKFIKYTRKKNHDYEALPYQYSDEYMTDSS